MTRAESVRCKSGWDCCAYAIVPGHRALRTVFPLELMKPLMHYMRQLHQRRINAFFFSGRESDAAQLSLQHIPRPQDRTRSLREMFADQEYDNDDDPADAAHA